MNRFIFIAISAAALAVGLWFGMSKPDPASAEFRADWSLPDRSGSLRHASEFDGRWQLINFWASWCAPCLEEIPLLIKVHEEHPKLQILGPALDRIEDASAAADRLKIPYPVLLGDLAVSDWMTQSGDNRGALPYSVLVDPSGKIREKHWGALSEKQIKQWLALTESFN